MPELIIAPVMVLPVMLMPPGDTVPALLTLPVKVLLGTTMQGMLPELVKAAETVVQLALPNVTNTSSLFEL